MKVKIIKDYRFEINNPSCTAGMIGCIGNYVQVFKVGEIVDGGFGVSQGGLSSDGKYFVKGMGNWTIQIPIENVQLLNDDGTLIANSTADVAPQTFLQKNKTNLLIAGVLVLGYFAYKKLKK
jgi:hypothetical protein